MATRSTDPLVGFSFSLDVQGTVAGYFQEISGLGSENEIVENKVVTETGIQVIQKLPGRLKFTDVTLKRGVTGSMDIWDWRKKVELGDIGGARKNATITMYDQALAPVAKWNLVRCWPTKVSGPSMNSETSGAAIEEVSITFEEMTRAQ